MKRIITLALAALLILCGCNTQPEPTTAPTAPPATNPIPVTEPIGIYDAASAIEASTGGALQAYPLSRIDSIGAVPMGDDLLLFSGVDCTTLTKLSGENLHTSAVASVSCSIYPSDAAVQVSDTGVTYYNECSNQLIFLDAQLKEVKQVSLPENISGMPALSADRQQLYYCTADALRCMNLETGLDRLVKEMYFYGQCPTALLYDDTVISCAYEDDDGNDCQLFISTQTGELLNETFHDITIWTHGTSYFAQNMDGVYPELLIGDSEQGPTLLTPHTYGSTVFPVLEIGGVVLVTEDTAAENMQLDYYDLYSGKRTSMITLSGQEPLWSLHADAKTRTIWFLRYDPQYECEVLYRWDPVKTQVSGGTSCLSSRYTFENPDFVGLAACRETADALSEEYGVQILLWTDATAFQPWDYTLVPEYQVRVIQQELTALGHFLALYPEGFLKMVAERTTSGRIQICLVRSILGNGSDDGTLGEAVGLQYWDDNKNAYLSLAAAQDQLLQNACHELFHIIDSRVMTVSKAYDDWNTLNPKGFSYDYDYIANLSREDYQWTEGEDRAFIDIYSMSYPKEDRARIMEYAMMLGNEDCFESETMQRKLRQLCLGIRDAFGLKKSTEAFLWEQYLNEPLNGT